MALPTEIQTSYVQTILGDSSRQKSSSKHERIKSSLKLQTHPEGGYFVETDRDPLTVPNPFKGTAVYPNASVKPDDSTNVDNTPTRNASTTIHYYLDPARPYGVFHRNKGRTVHTAHWGRSVYVLIHANEIDTNTTISTTPSTLTTNANESSHPKARVETVVLGLDIDKGEVPQLLVEGGKFKASFLLPDSDIDIDTGVKGASTASTDNIGGGGGGGDDTSERGLLITETVVPGFDFMDHDFLTAEGLTELVGDETASRLKWLLKEERKELERS